MLIIRVSEKILIIHLSLICLFFEKLWSFNAVKDACNQSSVNDKSGDSSENDSNNHDVTTKSFVIVLINIINIVF